MAEETTPTGAAAAGSSDPDDSRFLERVMRYLEDELSEQGVALLREELAEDARKREIFAQICVSDTLAHEELRGMMAANPAIDEHPESASSGDSMHDTMVLPAIARDIHLPSEDGDAQSLEHPNTPNKPNAPPRKPWLKYGSWAAVLILGITAFLVFHSTPKPALAATLTSTSQAQWADPSASPPADGQLRVGEEIDLKSGCAALLFPNSTRLVAEGPVRIKFNGPNAVELLNGKISVKMQSGQSGFVVTTPDCKVTDLGTEFGVYADSLAKSTDVHVFSGRVQVVVDGSSAAPQMIGIGGLAHIAAGVVRVTPDASLPQLFVQDLSQSTTSLELADLLSGGDGIAEHRGGVLDPASGAFGIWGVLDPWYDKTSTTLMKDNGLYHRCSALPVIDGCFIPTGAMQQVDSAGNQYSCPACAGGSAMRLCVAGSVAPLPGGKTITPKLGDTNFSFAGHSYVMVCPNLGFTLDLSAMHHIHPAGQISRFRCKFGNFGSTDVTAKADLLLLVDGVQRFSKTGFTPQDGLISVDVPLAASDRFLTIITTDGGTTGKANNLFLGDACLDQVHKN